MILKQKNWYVLIIENKEKEKNSMKKNNLKNIIISVVLGIAAFVIMLVAISYVGKNENYVELIWSAKTIPQGTIITESNYDTYFTVIKTNDTVMTGGISYPDKNDIIGSTISRDISQYELISNACITQDEYIAGKYNEPVLVSATTSSFSTAANGIIRRGDYVNIYRLSMSSDSASSVVNAELVLSNVYIVDAFDSAGVKILPGDTTSIATSFNFYVEAEREASIQNQVSDKKISISKINN